MNSDRTPKYWKLPDEPANSDNQLTDRDILDVMAKMDESSNPTALHYWRPYWHRHPIKRLKQEYQKWRLNRM